jgi:hypothetical protein
LTKVPVIRSEGDLEVVLLHEAHGLLADIIGPDLYTVGGTPPEQSVLFHTHSSFNLFLILLLEFIAEGQQSTLIDEKYQNLSLLKGLVWFCAKHENEANENDLVGAILGFESWVKKEVPIKFWCPEVDTEIEFVLSNEQLISFGANTTKHHLFRLSALLGKLESKCNNAGYSFLPQQLSAVLSSMIEEVNSRLQYHSSNIIEMLGTIFLRLNALIIGRFEENPTNRVSEMVFPEGLTSDIFKDMYGSVLVFKRYENTRISNYTPTTTRFLKMRY